MRRRIRRKVRAEESTRPQEPKKDQENGEQ
jgi:hypothetical protein